MNGASDERCGAANGPMTCHRPAGHDGEHIDSDRYVPGKSASARWENTEEPYRLDFSKMGGLPTLGAAVEDLIQDYISSLSSGLPTSEGMILAIMNLAAMIQLDPGALGLLDEAVKQAGAEGRITSETWGYLVGRSPIDAIEAHDDVTFTETYLQFPGESEERRIHIAHNSQAQITYAAESVRELVMKEYAGRGDEWESFPIK